MTSTTSLDGSTNASAPPEHMWGCYAEVAAALLKGREEGYPRLVDDGKLDQPEAERRIAIMRAAVEIWRSAWECRRPDRAIVGTVDRCDIVAELDRARQVTARRLAADPGHGGAVYQMACLDDMIAWHTRYTDGPHFCVRLTLQLRAHAAAPSRQAA